MEAFGAGKPSVHNLKWWISDSMFTPISERGGGTNLRFSERTVPSAIYSKLFHDLERFSAHLPGRAPTTSVDVAFFFTRHVKLSIAIAW
jgi:hypothetical protein